MKMQGIMLAAAMGALPLSPVVAHAGSVQVGDINSADINAQNMDGCGLSLSRASVWRNAKDFEGPYIFVDNGSDAIVRLDGEIVRLTQTNDKRDMLSSGPTRDTYTNADGTISVTENTHTTKVFGDELWWVSGKLTVTVKGKTEVFAVKGEGGC